MGHDVVGLFETEREPGCGHVLNAVPPEARACVPPGKSARCDVRKVASRKKVAIVSPGNLLWIPRQASSTIAKSVSTSLPIRPGQAGAWQRRSGVLGSQDHNMYSTVEGCPQRLAQDEKGSGRKSIRRKACTGGPWTQANGASPYTPPPAVGGPGWGGNDVAGTMIKANFPDALCLEIFRGLHRLADPDRGPRCLRAVPASRWVSEVLAGTEGGRL